MFKNTIFSLSMIGLISGSAHADNDCKKLINLVVDTNNEEIRSIRGSAEINLAAIISGFGGAAIAAALLVDASFTTPYEWRTVEAKLDLYKLYQARSQYCIYAIAATLGFIGYNAWRYQQRQDRRKALKNINNTLLQESVTA